MIAYLCRACGARHDVTLSRFRCECGAPLDLEFEPRPLDRTALTRRPASIWRYHEVLPLAELVCRTTLGEGLLPVIDDALGATSVHLALDYVSPSGSYKDRGAAMLVALANWLGADELVDDTSGNAGIALAAHAARAGLAVRLFVPEEAAEEKPRIAASFGAEIVRVPGGRSAASAAAVLEAEQGAFYASHAWSPFFLHGVKSLAYAICESLGWIPPGGVVVPCGNGGLVLGLDLGFREMRRAGLIHRRPALVAVQAEACAPIAAAWRRKEPVPVPVEDKPTIADGIRVSAPPRGAAVLEALASCGGSVETVGEDEIAAAWAVLWKKGYAVEPTSATVAACVLGNGPRLRAEYGDVVLVLTGSGLKGGAP